ncbi:MAG: hypothetical protein ACOY4O_04455 [Pseudomonadota bacterium]
MSRQWMSLGRLAPIAVLMAASPALAQSPPPGAARSGGAYASAVSDFDDAIVPPREAIRMLRSTGYTVLSRPRPAGLVLYSIAVITPRGDDGRIYMDIRDGRLVRFVPGYALTPRTDEDIDLAYNPPSPPPAAAPRKPAAKPKAASLPPATTTGPARSKTKQAAPKLPEIKPAETKPAQTSPAPAPVTAAAPAPAPQTQGVATRPAEAKPPVVILPTQEMPAVLGLE